VREDSRNVELFRIYFELSLSFEERLGAMERGRLSHAAAAAAAASLLLLLLLQVTLQQYSMQPKAMLSGPKASGQQGPRLADSRSETDIWKSGEQPNVIGNWITVSAPTVKPVAHFWVSFRVDCP